MLRDLYSKFDIEISRVVFHVGDRAYNNELHAISVTIPAMLSRWHMDTDSWVSLRVVFGEEQNKLYKSQLNAEGRIEISSYGEILNASTEENYVEAIQNLENHIIEKFHDKEMWINFSRYLEKESTFYNKLCVGVW